MHSLCGPAREGIDEAWMWESAGLPPPTAGLNLGGHRPHLKRAPQCSPCTWIIITASLTVREKLEIQISHKIFGSLRVPTNSTPAQGNCIVWKPRRVGLTAQGVATGEAWAWLGPQGSPRSTCSLSVCCQPSLSLCPLASRLHLLPPLDYLSCGSCHTQTVTVGSAAASC